MRRTKVVAKYPEKGYYGFMIKTVEFSKRALKSIKKLGKPEVAQTVQTWKKLVEESGIHAVQGIREFRDHSLEGKLKKSGLRSVKLDYGYRLYYRLTKTTVECVLVEDVNNHDYKEIERLFGG